LGLKTASRSFHKLLAHRMTQGAFLLSDHQVEPLPR